MKISPSNKTIFFLLKKKIGVKIIILKVMFDLKELSLMFLDPTDLIINNINKFLNSKKTIKFIFS